MLAVKLLQQNQAVLNWVCQLTHVDVYISCKMVYVCFVILLPLHLLDLFHWLRFSSSVVVHPAFGVFLVN